MGCFSYKIRSKKKLTEYNIFVKEELTKLKEKNPNIDTKILMIEIDKLWKEINK